MREEILTAVAPFWIETALFGGWKERKQLGGGGFFLAYARFSCVHVCGVHRLGKSWAVDSIVHSQINQDGREHVTRIMLRAYILMK